MTNKMRRLQHIKYLLSLLKKKNNSFFDDYFELQ